MWKPKKKVQITRRAVIGLTAAAILFAALAVVANRMGGVVTDTVSRVEDGATLFVGLTKVRLRGIAVPALDQPLGKAAMQALADAALGKTASCRLSGSRSWDRIDAHCTVEGQDLAEMMIRSGLARDCPRESEGRYAAFEADRGETFPLPDDCHPSP